MPETAFLHLTSVGRRARPLPSALVPASRDFARGGEQPGAAAVPQRPGRAFDRIRKTKKPERGRSSCDVAQDGALRSGRLAAAAQAHAVLTARRPCGALLPRVRRGPRPLRVSERQRLSVGNAGPPGQRRLLRVLSRRARGVRLLHGMEDASECGTETMDPVGSMTGEARGGFASASGLLGCAKGETLGAFGCAGSPELPFSRPEGQKDGVFSLDGTSRDASGALLGAAQLGAAPLAR